MDRLKLSFALFFLSCLPLCAQIPGGTGVGTFQIIAETLTPHEEAGCSMAAPCTPAVVTRFGGWAGNLWGTSWIAPDPDQSNATRNGSYYGSATYQTTFPATAGSALNLRVLADDNVTVTLNGTIVPPVGNAGYYLTAGIYKLTGLKTTNTVTFVVSNAGGGPTGLDAAFSDPNAPSGPSLAFSYSKSPTSYPDPMYFVPTLLSSTAAQTISVINNGDAPAIFSSLGITTSAFSIDPKTLSCGVPLAPGGYCTFSIVFAPTSPTPGIQTAGLKIILTGPPAPNPAIYTVPLSGSTGPKGLADITGNGPLTATPASLTFAATPNGGVSAEQIVKISNAGSLLAVFSDYNIPSNFAIDYHPPTTLAPACIPMTDYGASLAPAGQPGDSCVVGITYNPSTATVTNYFSPKVEFGIDLHCTLCNGDQWPPVPLVATTGNNPALTFSPNPVVFPGTAAGASSTLPVTVKNTGNQPAMITGPLPVSGAFALLNPSNCPSIAPGLTCTMSVTFTPLAAAGTVLTADPLGTPPNALSITLPGNLVFNLAAKGTVVAAAPALTATPAVISMSAAVSSGDNLFTPRVTLTNTSSGPVSISDITTTNSDIVVLDKVNNCRGLTFQSGGTCTFDVYFNPPSTVGTTKATITVSGSSPLTIQFTGIATASTNVPAVTFKDSANRDVTSLGLSFAQDVGTSQVQTLSVTNSGKNATLNISGVSLTDTKDFAFANNNCLNAQVSAGNACPIDIQFSPQSYGPIKGALVITDNASGGTQQLTLNGNGTGPGVLSFSSSSLTFTTVINGVAPPKKFVTISNTGGQSVTISSFQLNHNDGFVLDFDTCYQFTLAPQYSGGTTCQIGISFEPSSVGHVVDKLAVITNPQAINNIMVLNGFGACASNCPPPSSLSATPHRQLDAVDGAPDPVDGATGQFYEDEPDLRLGGPLSLDFVRYYSSQLSGAGFTSALGPNWMTNFDVSMALSGNNAQVVMFRGKDVNFSQANGAWTLVSPADVGYQFAVVGTGYQFLSPDSRHIYSFDSSGRLSAISDLSGNTVTVTQGENGPAQIADGQGRSLTLTYTGGLLTQVQDQTGRSVQYSYTGGALTSATDAAGNTTNYSYTVNGSMTALMVKKQLPMGNAPTTQSYDAQGKVTSQTDANGNTTAIAYDGQGGTTITGALGDVTQQGNNIDGDLAQLTDPNGGQAGMTFDNAFRRTSVTDRLGNTTSFTYDAPTGKIASRTDENGNTTSYTYSPQTQGAFTVYNLTGIQYPDGGTSSFQYDSHSRMTAMTQRDGSTRHYVYDNNGRVTSYTGPDGQTTSYTYNPDGTTASVQDAAGNLTSYAYNPAKQVVKITNPNGGATLIGYDAAGRQVSRTDPTGAALATHFNANGQQDTWTSATGGVFGFTYTGNGQIATYTDPLGNKTTYSSDAEGRMTSARNAAGEASFQTFDKLGRVASISGNNGTLYSYGYDAEGHLLSATDAAGGKTSYSYDPTGLLIGATSPGGNQWTMTYDKVGRLLSSTNPLGEVQTLTRDAMGRVTQVTFPGGLTTSIRLNALGQTAAITSPNGNTWTVDHDAVGRIARITDPLGNATSRSYTGAQLTGQTFPLGSVTYTNDANGRILQRSFSDGTTINTAYDPMELLLSADGVSITRDAKGMPSSVNGMAVTYTAGDHPASITYAPGKTVTYGYDTDGRVTSITDWVGGQTAITYDATGRPASVTYPNSVANNFTYNQDGRVIQIAAGSLASITLTRDADGKIVAANRNLPTAPALQGSNQQVSYNAAGQLVQGTFDLMGRATAESGRTYTWNLADQLTGFSDGVNSGNLTYDGLGEVSSSTATGATQSFVFNHLSDYPSLSIVRQAGGDLRYFVYLPNGKLLYSVEAADNSRKFYHFDEMGNTAFLTGDDGSVTDTYAVTPYGDVADHVGSADNPFTWQGQYGVMQEAPGLYFLRNRHYDAALGRFLSADPAVTSHPLAAEPYAYAMGNPLLYIDPYGDLGWGDVGNFFGAIGTGVVNGAKAVGSAVVVVGTAVVHAAVAVGSAVGHAVVGAGSAVVHGVESGVTAIANLKVGTSAPATHTTPPTAPPAVAIVIPAAGATLRVPILSAAAAQHICQKLKTCPQSLLTALAAVISNDGGSLISSSQAAAIAKLISQDGAGLISQDGAGLISQDGAGLISQDGAGVISNDGGSVISNDGGSVISNDGGSVISNDGGSIKTVNNN